MVVLCCANLVYGQPPGGFAPAAASYQAYSLRYANAEQVKPQLERLLAGTEAAEIVADAATNRLFVGGTATAQALVAQSLNALDQPPASPQPNVAAPAAAPTSIAAYTLPGVPSEALAAELQQRFGPLGARAASDPRTGQVLVVGTADVQRQVASHVMARSASAASPPSPTSSAGVPAKSNEVATRRVALSRADWPEIESRLRALYGARLASTSEAEGGVRARLSLAGTEPLDIVHRPTSREVEVFGRASAVEAAARLIIALDRGQGDGKQHVVPLRAADQESIRRAMTVSHRLADAGPSTNPTDTAGPVLPRAVPLVGQMFQTVAQAQPPVVPAAPAVQAAPGANRPPVNQPGVAAPPAGQAVAPGIDPNVAAAAAAQASVAGLVGPVQIEYLDGLDVLVVSGNDRDVERVLKIIEDIEKLSVDTQPTIEVVNLEHVSGEALAAIVSQIYTSVLSSRQGSVSITALVKPNALLLIGRGESVQAVKELITKLDQPVEPQSQFAVFPLKYASAATVQATLQNFFGERPGLGPKVQAIADIRSNSLIVRAGPRDLVEAGELIKRLDVAGGEAENELRVFHLTNALADELAPVLQEAVNTQLGGAANAGAGGNALQSLINPGATTTPSTTAPATPGARAATLKFSTIDSEGHKQYRSGILTEVRITADARANSIVVSAPADAMELIAALIKQLDEVPAARAQIKVFTIVNGDASALVEMLNALFGRTTSTAGGGFGALGAAAQQQQSQNLLVPLRFSVDQRTNSIIASGSEEDLTVVEAILLRLDDSDIRQRQSIVYRLKNAPAADVATAINEFLRSEREVQQVTPGLISPFEQIEREVVVVPEPVSNSLIVSSTPRYFEEIRKLVEDIDRRPPMVMIQVLIAEVSLNNTDEFGVEVGLQDSILFDRSLLGDIVTITQSTQTPQGNTVVTTTNQNVVAATNTPGYAFNNAPLGNSGATNALANSGRVGSQGLTNFAVGRTNADLGFGGLVLSASSESVSVLIRALQESRRLDVLSRPQVMTLDNQPAFVQVGSRVPRVQGVTINQTGQVNNVVDVNVGLILGVTPRISPDGLVVMEIDAEKSALGPEIEGVPISVSATGEVVRQPLINTTTAQTTVSAMNGQTVVLGGLITKAHSVVKRRVPYLSDIPILGNLFRYDNDSSERTELLIIMTPHIVKDERDATRLRQVESARMSWCLGDVKSLMGNAGLYSRDDIFSEDETMVIYPDVSPTGEPVPSVPDVSSPIEGPSPTPPAVPMPPMPNPPAGAPEAPAKLPAAEVPQADQLPDASPQSSVAPIPVDQAAQTQMLPPPGETPPQVSGYPSPPHSPPPNVPLVVPAQYYMPTDPASTQGVAR